MDFHWLIPLILVALFFDFLNGFHDSANSIATIVATRVLTPQIAVLWAAFFNLLGPLFFGEHVAKTIGKGIVAIGVVNHHLVLAALLGAIVWNLITWYLGLPSSSSHALIGGLVGAAFYKANFSFSVLMWKGIGKVVLFIFLSPLIGFFLGGIIFVAVAWICRRKTPFKVDSAFRKLQLVSSALYSIGHGTNDAQKTMGIIFMLLVTGKYIGSDAAIPLWVMVMCSVAIALGTACGGWRIVRTMGSRITRLTPCGGFCAEAAGAAALFGTSLFGIPVSTTHTITGAIAGVGTTIRPSAVRWRIATRIVWAWVFTIPAAAVIAMAAQAIITQLAGL
ncbi:MAG: inorganic phosphate transporter [Verrucomicrobia bacterium]|nr:inorganic phosphate transporter [Verrucomicrobiota bacterium]